MDEELQRAGQKAQEMGADEATQQRVRAMWEKAAAPALIATAESYRIGDPPTGRLIRPNNAEGWETECWQYYDSVGELHYVAGQNGRSVAQARLFVAKYDDDGVPREVETGDAAALSRDLLGGETMSAELKWALGVQGMISGQSLITVSDDDGWAVWSDQDFKLDKQELKRANDKGGSPYLVDRGGARKERLPKGTLVIHMWDRHPGRAWQVDSSTRPAIPYLRELCRLDQYVQATLLSRIAVAGILQVPAEAAPIAPPGANVPEGMDPLMHMLATVGQANIANPGTAAAILPVLLKMPADTRLEHLKLDYELTGIVNEFREMNLRRVAMSMDMAPETMTGFSGVKYSNAEFIQSESIRTHVVRRVAAIASALTKGLIVPALDDTHVVRWDLSDLEIKPDRTEAAIQLYDRGELNGDGLRTFTGLRDGEAPDGPERVKILAFQALKNHPDLWGQLAPLLGLKDTIRVESTTQRDEPRQLEDGQGEQGPAAPSDTTTEAPADPGEPAPAAPQPPATPAATASARPDVRPLVAACDVVVCSALGRAGAAWRKRKRSRVAACRDVDTQAIYLVHSLTADREPHETPREHAEAMFGGSFPQVPGIAAKHGANPECLQASLAGYVSELIVDRRPHDLDRLTHVVEGCVDGAE
ncbi:hypothetical protein [Amycolatopsis thermophila]|uniref:Portal protein n=1 Tax=Amycolatopsis thermophila TaxID=206084 RepID=A0ABU0EMJ3_9PSEU|nr:hypothetical protein [Amycolatopsis thermophila]MDQ0376503.1 hypothetical protein [Amycolatopsis thermophila]